MLQIVARAAPGQMVRMLADASHCEELQQDPHLTTLPNLEFEHVSLPEHHRGAVNVVCPRRFREEFAVIRSALVRVPRGEPCLLILTSATGTQIQAALLAGRLCRGPFALQVALHGYLNNAMGWRSSIPLARWFDLRGMLGRKEPRLRFLVFEECIKRELERLVPGTAKRTDVLPHPVNTSELAAWRQRKLEFPIDVGLVGLATEAKGISPYLQIAASFRAQLGEAVRFHVVGCRPEACSADRFTDIAHEVPVHAMPRSAFVERLAGLHYVMLPIQPQYYRLSASGGLLDAVTWLKPVMAFRLPIVEDMFAAAGDIGYLADDVAAMQSTLADIIAKPDPERYIFQMAALRLYRDRRTPEALAPTYQQILAQGWPGILPDNFAAGAGAPPAAAHHARIRPVVGAPILH